MDFVHYHFSKHALGVMIGLLRLVAGLFTIVSLIQKGEKQFQHNFVLIRLYKDIEPFSFLKWVFISKNNNFSEQEETEIIAHERAHVQQKHSFYSVCLNH